MSELNRRQFLQNSLLAAGVQLLPLSAFLGNRAEAATADDHFFILFTITGGMDQSYVFDARSLAMTAAGKQLNYKPNVESKPYTGSNGQTTLLGSVGEALRPYLDRFSLINGVMMSPSFDGHEQNYNMLFSGSAFGGDSFVPVLNRYGKGQGEMRPLDAISKGEIFGVTIRNGDRTVPLTADDALSLSAKLKANPLPDMNTSISKFVRARRERRAAGSGGFAVGSRNMLGGFTSAPDLADLITKTQLPSETKNAAEKQVYYLREMFKNGVARGAVITLRAEQMGNVDSHDLQAAKGLPALLTTLVEQLKQHLQALIDVPFDDKRSLLDVTTVCFASEFSRTMRQYGFPIDATASDHNALTNSVLIGGKGIRGGLVIGESDFRAADEKLSGAHNQIDPLNIKIMGRPFDFKTMRPRQDLPSTLVQEDYLNITSVTNTIYKAFNVDQSQYRLVRVNGGEAPVLSGLLA